MSLTTQRPKENQEFSSDLQTVAVSTVDKEFLERIAPTLEDIQLTRVGDMVQQSRPKSRYGSSREIQQAMAEKRRNYQKKEEKRGEVLSEKETDLWENEKWRDRIKDLSSSFSKLLPIHEGKRTIAGKGQSFIVDVSLLED